MAKVTVYGADWCSMTRDSRELLDGLNVNYDYINIEEDAQAAEWVRNQNDGKERKPTINIDGQVLSEPSNAELKQALKAKNIVG